ncbi:MAG: transposase [Candidatus Obscuribacterales bacterium]|nr:transposase [Candidatus Obscuribacterales bacterium]
MSRRLHDSIVSGAAMLKWSATNDVFLDYIQPGKSMENAICESFNDRFRDECLNEHWFTDIYHVRSVIEGWRLVYNEARPNGSLGLLTPKEFSAFFNMEDLSA